MILIKVSPICSHQAFWWARPILGMDMPQEARTGMVLSCLKPHQAREFLVFILFLFFFRCALSMLSVWETMIQMREVGEAGWAWMAIGALSEE